MTKYKARKASYGERTYDSMGEAKAAQALDLMVAAGEVEWWIPQVAFTFPWKSKHKVDFLVVFKSCGVRLVEYKGMDTPLGKFKRKILEWYMGEPIIVWHKEDVGWR